MFYELTEEQKAIKRLAQDFAEKRLAKVQEEDESNHLFRREVITEMGQLGLLGTVIAFVELSVFAGVVIGGVYLMLLLPITIFWDIKRRIS